MPIGTTSVEQSAGKSPELLAAEDKVDQAKDRLDLARKQLSAARALVKAAESEYKARRADRDALALRQTANQLADASGFAGTSTTDPVSKIIIPTNGGSRLTPAQPAQLQPAAQAPQRGQQIDFNAQPQDTDEQRHSAGAPVPVADLKPSINNVSTQEPNSVP